MMIIKIYMIEIYIALKHLQHVVRYCQVFQLLKVCNRHINNWMAEGRELVNMTAATLTGWMYGFFH